MRSEGSGNQTAGVGGFPLHLKILLLKREGKSGTSQPVYLMRERVFVPNLERAAKQSIAVVKCFFCTSAKVTESLNPGRERAALLLPHSSALWAQRFSCLHKTVKYS